MESSIAEKITLLNQTTLESLNETDKAKIAENFTKTGLKILEADFGFALLKNQSGTHQLAYKSPGITAPVLNKKQASNYSGSKVKILNPKEGTDDFKTQVVIPVKYKKNKYGSIVFSYKAEKTFSDEEDQLFSALGSAAGQAITINRLHANLQDYKYTLDNTLDSIFIFNPKTFRIAYANKGTSFQLGFKRNELLNRSLLDILHHQSRKLFRARILELDLTPGSPVVFETSLRHKNRTIIQCELLLQKVAPSGEPARLLAIVRDISERKKAEATIRHMAYYDGLTDLPNRSLFSIRLKQALQKAKRGEYSAAVLFLDLDRFKIINDILGHTAGDKLLKEIATRLRKTLDKGIVISRMGGDEFMVLLPKIAEEQEAVEVAKSITKSFKQPFVVDRQEIYMNASIGIGVAPRDGLDSLTLLKNVDLALHRAKEGGGNNFRSYFSDIAVSKVSHLQLEKQLRHALDAKELLLYYQPQVDLKLSRIVGAEALVRWQHPTLGLIYPGEFIQHAEESGLIIEIGEWALKEACLQNKAWQDAGLPNISVSVNLSPRQLLQQNFADMVKGILKETGLRSKFLELELTETQLMKDIELSIEVLKQFKAMGVNILIDDFGTGYASLTYLKRLPVQVLKIDRSFISSIPKNLQDTALINAIITVGHQLDLKIVAEGVETRDQIMFLRAQHCDFIQGDYVSKPIPAKDFAELLTSHFRLKV